MSAEKHRGFAFVEFELAEVRGGGGTWGHVPFPRGPGLGAAVMAGPGVPSVPYSSWVSLGLRLGRSLWVSAWWAPRGAVPLRSQNLPKASPTGAFLPSRILVSLGKVLPRRL